MAGRSSRRRVEGVNYPRQREIIQRKPAKGRPLERQVHDILAGLDALTGDGGYLERTNKQSLKWLQNKAQENLASSIRKHKRPRFSSSNFRTQNLSRAIGNDKYSEATKDKVRFIIDHKIRPDVPYYGSIEFGDHSQIGRKIDFAFLSVRSDKRSRNFRRDPLKNYQYAQKNRVQRSNDPKKGIPDSIRRHEAGRFRKVRQNREALRTDRLIGPREQRAIGHEGKRFYVTIRRPVPAYHYARKAGQQFVRQDIYARLLEGYRSELRQRYGLDLARITDRKPINLEG